MIYLDNGATTFPKPRCVVNSVMNTLLYLGGSPGRGSHRSSISAGEMVYRTREVVGEMFGCESEGVIFTDNCTSALNTAIKGVCKKGDKAVISSLEHNSVLRPIEKIKRMGLICYEVVKVNPNNDDETVEKFRRAIVEDVKAVICTFSSNVFGTVLPIERIGKLCKEKGVIFIVDAAQAGGIFPIDMKRMNIDILCLPGHKSLYGPMGTGIMLLSGRIMPDELKQGGTGSNSLEIAQPMNIPDRYESGTLNLPGIAGLYSGIGFVRSFGGEEAIRKKESELVRILEDDLSVINNVRVYTEMKGHISAPVISFNIKGLHSEEVSGFLDKGGFAVRAGYHCSKLAHETYGTGQTGCVRVTPGIFNSKKDIKNFVFCCNKIALRKIM